MKNYSFVFNKGDVVVGTLFIAVIAGLVYKGVYTMAQLQKPLVGDKQIFR